MDFAGILKTVNDFVWGPFMLILLVGTGVFLTFQLKFLPWRNLGFALRSIFKDPEKDSMGNREGDITPFQSLMTALAATIGTGNIVGVATAMVMGGPGAIVWMWISALFGLSTKYAESVLAVKYREMNADGEMVGGPMYTMKNGFRNKKVGAVLATLFAVFAVLASFGIGNMTQANSIADALNSTFKIPNIVISTTVTLTMQGKKMNPLLYRNWEVRARWLPSSRQTWVRTGRSTGNTQRPDTATGYLMTGICRSGQVRIRKRKVPAAGNRHSGMAMHMMAGEVMAARMDPAVRKARKGAAARTVQDSMEAAVRDMTALTAEAVTVQGKPIGTEAESCGASLLYL